MIKHIWFDFSETLGSITKEAHENLRHETYAKLVGKKINEDLRKEYEDLREKHKSNSAVFKSLGKPVTFWAKLVGAVDPKTFYSLTDENIPNVLQEMSKIIPISIFSNIDADKILSTLGVDLKLFTHFISASEIDAPKPALEGFYKMIELSKLPAEEILYIGDHLEKDVIPAKKVGIKSGVVFEKIPEADYYFKDFKDIL